VFNGENEIIGHTSKTLREIVSRARVASGRGCGEAKEDLVQYRTHLQDE